MLRRVARCVAHGNVNRSDVDRVAVMEEACAGRCGEAVLPVGTSAARQQQLRARSPRQLARAGDEVGVDVRLGDVADRQLRVCFAASMYRSTSRFGSTTIAVRVTSQPTR